MPHAKTFCSQRSALVGLASAGQLVGMLAAQAPPAPDPAAATPFAASGSLTEHWFGKDNPWDSAYDAWTKWKADNHIPISMGAQHWWNIDRDERVYGSGYGVPGLRGTYFYWLNVDPTVRLSDDDFVREIGIHVEGRIRDDETKLRSFYRRTYWTYEAYAFAKTELGTFKAGQIVEQFALPWDNSWWEGVSYFDEYRFNPSIGVTWNNTWKFNDRLSLDTATQYFVQGDRVSGALAFATAATSGFDERNSVILRAIPTWQIDDDWRVAWGIAGLTRQIQGGEEAGLDDRQVAGETDVTVSYRNFSVWAQYIDSRGVISPRRYVSNGPSDRQTSLSGGVNYKLGPIAAHVNYSKGWDHDPDGDQFIFQPGITFQLAKNLTIYTEYVRWDLTNSEGKKSVFGDGFQLVMVWRL